LGGVSIDVGGASLACVHPDAAKIEEYATYALSVKTTASGEDISIDNAASYFDVNNTVVGLFPTAIAYMERHRGEKKGPLWVLMERHRKTLVETSNTQFPVGDDIIKKSGKEGKGRQYSHLFLVSRVSIKYSQYRKWVPSILTRAVRKRLLDVDDSVASGSMSRPETRRKIDYNLELDETPDRLSTLSDDEEYSTSLGAPSSGSRANTSVASRKSTSLVSATKQKIAATSAATYVRGVAPLRCSPWA